MSVSSNSLCCVSSLSDAVRLFRMHVPVMLHCDAHALAASVPESAQIGSFLDTAPTRSMSIVFNSALRVELVQRQCLSDRLADRDTAQTHTQKGSLERVYVVLIRRWRLWLLWRFVVAIGMMMASTAAYTHFVNKSQFQNWQDDETARGVT